MVLLEPISLPVWNTYNVFFFWFLMATHCCSVAKLCWVVWHPMDCSTPGFPVLHHLPELAQTHVHWVGDAIQPSCPVILISSCLQSFPASGSFLMNWLFVSGGQSTGASASASGLPMNIQVDFLQDWLVWSPCSPRDSQESSPTPQFKSINSSVLGFLYGPALTSLHVY